MSAPGCISCGRPTKSPDGFCWQHSDMVKFLPDGEKCLLTLENGKKIILLKSKVVEYQAEHKDAIFIRAEPYPHPEESK